jgi:large subunit ribosomal protein L3
MLGLLARKVGMTQVFSAEGNLLPVTVLRVDPNVVVAQRTVENAGYSAVVLGVDDKAEHRVSKPYKGQFTEGVAPKKVLKEIRDFDRECKIGDIFDVSLLENTPYIDVSGVSKGKGFQGVVRRWHFGGGRRSHGSKFHREPGGTGQSTYPGKTFKNVKLPGHMGHENTTMLNLRVVKIDTENSLVLVGGAVPGVKKGLVLLRPAVKKQRI